jgi:hypothetical protein
MPQTSMTSNPSVAYAGMIADASPFNDQRSAVVEETLGIEPGLLVVRGVGGDMTARLPVAVAADDDAILEALATSGSEQVIDSEADGVIALGRISPARKLTFTRDAHTDHSAVTAVLVGLNEEGVRVTENLTFADDGDEVVTSANYYTYFISLTIPAQAGAGGTTAIGISASFKLTPYEILGVSMRTHKALLDPSSSDNEVFEDEDVMPYLRRGYIYVTVENAFTAGQRPLVRCIAAGAEKLGAFRVDDTDGDDCAELVGARLLNSGSAGALGKLEVNF